MKLFATQDPDMNPAILKSQKAANCHPKNKDKAVSVGTLANFEKVNAILNALGTMSGPICSLGNEKSLFHLSRHAKSGYYPKSSRGFRRRAFVSSRESNGAGYILLPRGDNYDRIKNLFQNIFTMGNQTDIKPK